TNTALQDYAQKVADEAAAKYAAPWGAAEVRNRAGNILAPADANVVNPNDPDTDQFTGAHSVQDAYAPGSTGKVLTVLSALEEGEVTPTTPIEDPYEYTTENGQVIHDHTMHPDRTLTTTGVLVHSSNVGTVEIGSRMDPQT